MDVSIVIPTKNAGNDLKNVLEAIFAQKTKYSFEVICVDSGSSDNTLDIIKDFEVRLFEIPPEEFGHGKTRNFGASKSTAEYVVFITQDALPADENWLESFIDAMNFDKSVVCGFGRHIPYPGCNFIDEMNINGLFKGFGEENTVYYMDDPERYKREEGYRHMLAFFSDNNSCVRRSVFEKHPYPDVNFAEDQIWTKEMIEAGYKKIYCPFAAVYHSHNYPLNTYFKRYFDEYKGLYKLHHYLIVKHWFLTVPAGLYLSYGDYKYLRSVKMPKKQKIKNMFYSIRRNQYKTIAGFLGGKYATYSKRKQKWLDKKISQQYEQRNK